MDIFETLSASDSSDEIETQQYCNLATSPSLKNSDISPEQMISVKDEKMMEIISANLNLNSKGERQIRLLGAVQTKQTLQSSSSQPGLITATLKNSYKDLKSNYLSAETLNRKLLTKINSRANSSQCKKCELLKDKNSTTKKALEEAVQLSSILLNEVHRLTFN